MSPIKTNSLILLFVFSFFLLFYIYGFKRIDKEIGLVWIFQTKNF